MRLPPAGLCLRLCHHFLWLPQVMACPVRLLLPRNEHIHLLPDVEVLALGLFELVDDLEHAGVPMLSGGESRVIYLAFSALSAAS